MENAIGKNEKSILMITIIILICTKIFYPELMPIYNRPTLEMQKRASFRQQSINSFM